MQKFKCKKCGKMVELLRPEEEIQRCLHCDTLYEYVWDEGWHYDVEGHRTRKCVYCKNNLFIPEVEKDKNELWQKIECQRCHKNNIVYWFYKSCELIPCDTLVESCAWCNEQLQINISETTNKWMTSGQGQYQKNIIACPHCKRKFVFSFGVGYGHPTLMVHSERIFGQGRKKKATKKMVSNFLDNNAIYKSYDIVHPYNAYEYCEQNHINEEDFFDLLEKMNYEIFDPIDLEDVEVSLYESEFTKLKLKESAMTEAGGASLSRVLGRNKAWLDLRKEVLMKNNYSCEICGYKVPIENTKALHVHEEWQLEQNIVTLKKVSLVCSRCHACKHVNQFIAYRVMDGQDELVEGIPRIDLITIHLMRVNGVAKEVIYAYRKMLRGMWKEKREEKVSQNSYSEECDMAYKYRIEPSIPNREAIIKTLQKKGLYQDE